MDTTVESWLRIVREKVASMRFGSINVTVHDGRVTQVDATEKVRFAASNDHQAHRPAPEE